MLYILVERRCGIVGMCFDVRGRKLGYLGYLGQNVFLESRIRSLVNNKLSNSPINSVTTRVVVTKKPSSALYSTRERLVPLC